MKKFINIIKSGELKILRKILKILALIVFGVSLIILIKLLIIEPQETDQLNKEIKNLYYNDSISDADKLAELLKLNSDIKGWIHVKNTQIDYPVLQSSGNPTYYLNHNYKKEVSSYGSIFIDEKCTDGVNSKNIVFHGHHMNNGQMFADLLKFADLNFYKQTPVIQFNTVDKLMNWKIISVFKTNTQPDHGKIFNYIKPKFQTSEEFLNYIKKVKIRSLIDCPVDVEQDDQIITLSTCSYEFEDFRTVVVARKLRDGESVEVDTESASKAKNPLMPDCWYKRYGGTPLKDVEN